MSAGTITLTHNSAAVTGAGTAFTTDLKAGDIIASVVGGVTYTLPVKTVNSAASVTLIKNYDGPTQAGAAWYAIPRDAMNAITAQLAADTAQALRGLNYDKQNWQRVFSATGNVTVKLPDGSSFTGPAWGGIATTLDGKLDLNSTPRFLTRIMLAGDLVGSSSSSLMFVEKTTNTSWGSIYSERLGDVTLMTTTSGDNKKYFQFMKTGQLITEGNITCLSLTQTCDRDEKDLIEPIVNALDKLDKINGYTYIFRDTGLPSAGIIAQEFKDILPDVISTIAKTEPKYNESGEYIGLSDNDDLKSLKYGIEPMGVIGFLVSALKEEKAERMSLAVELANLKERVEHLFSNEQNH